MVSVASEVDWLAGERRFPGEFRLPGIATLVRVSARTRLGGRSRFETRTYISSAVLDAARAAKAVRGHWMIDPVSSIAEGRYQLTGPLEG